MPQSLISIIVPCYNQAQYLDECLQSVIDQTYQDWECIIVNDGSPDNTEEVAKKWVEKDSRFKYLYKENGGLSSARNAGIEIAIGEWLQFLDCDDKITSTKFSESQVFFENSELILTDYQLFKEQSNLPNHCSFINQEITFENIIFNWDLNYSIPIHCALFKTKFISNFNENLKAKEDWLFWIEYMSAIKQSHVAIIDQKMALYRIHENSMTKDKNLMLSNELLAYQEIYKKLDSNLKELFFVNRLQYKNQVIKGLENNIIQKNGIIEKLKTVLTSKRYQIINKVFRIINR